MKKRIEWVDCAKGITILLVIVFHTIENGTINAAIGSFCMSLFFMLSAYTYKYSKNNEQFVTNFEKAFVHLMLPVYIMIILPTVYYMITHCNQFTSGNYIKTYLSNKILTLIFLSGWDVEVLSSHIEGIDMLWFLVALFVGRTLFEYLHLRLSRKPLIIWCLGLSLLGAVLAKIQWLPACLDIAFTIMPLFYLGSFFSSFKVENKPLIKLLVYGLIWLILIAPRYYFIKIGFDLNARLYLPYPLSLIIAVFGVLSVSEFSVLVVKLNKIVKPLIYLGKNSLYLYLIHSIDSCYRNMWKITDNGYLNCLCRMGIDILLFIVVMAIVEMVRKKRINVKKQPVL